MSNGGYREGAGRKKGTPNKKSSEIASKAFEEGITPLEYMLNILRDETQSDERRDWAAERAAPFIHPRLQSSTISGDPKKPPVRFIIEG